jgi:hypothetical protein
MSVKEEFATVDILLSSDAETRGVDAFALALIKAERQMRKLVTYLVFQSDALGPAHVAALRNALAARRVFFRHFLAAWDDLYARPLRELIGTDYERLRSRLSEATDYRNKIFHGQLTLKCLSRDDLKGYVTDIRSWCESLAVAALREIGYDGFDRSSPSGSFRKAGDVTVSARIIRKIQSVQDYETYLNELEKRPNIGLQPTTAA